MKSLKITLVVAVLSALFVLTVSSNQPEDKINFDAMEKVDKSEHKFTGPSREKGKLPRNNA